MKTIDLIFLAVLLLSTIIFVLYILTPKLFFSWKYRRFLINIPIILTIGVVITYIIYSNQRKKDIEQEYNLLKQSIDSMYTPSGEDSLDNEYQLIKGGYKIDSLINEKERINKRVGADRAIIDSLNQLQLRITEKLSKIEFEKSQYFKSEKKMLTSGGKILKSGGKILVTNVKVFNCLYNVENLTLTSNYKEIHSIKNAKISINLKYTITQNSGDISNKNIDSIMFLSFKLPNGYIEKNKIQKCQSDSISKQFSGCTRFNNLPHTDSLRLLLDISKMDTGIYYINFFTKKCNVCEYKFKI